MMTTMHSKEQYSITMRLATILCIGLMLLWSLEMSHSFMLTTRICKPATRFQVNNPTFSRRYDADVHPLISFSNLVTKAASSSVPIPDNVQSMKGLEESDASHAEGRIEKSRKKKSRTVTLWVHGLSIYILLVNYTSILWPQVLLQIPFKTLSLVHAVSAMFFSGSIVTTTILEWIVVRNGNKSVNQFWFQTAPLVERSVVLPSITVSILSGMVQSFVKYGSLQLAPKHVKSSFHLLLLFGAWWGITDRTTQGQAQIAADELQEEQTQISNDHLTGNVLIPSVFLKRRISNVVSCIFIAALYGVMVLKPGFNL